MPPIVPDHIPSMGGREIGEVLHRFASQTRPDQFTVEVGAWLGAGTWALAQGLLDAGAPKSGAPRLHVYELFKMAASGAEKAKKAGVDVRPGQNVYGLVKDTLAPIGLPIEWHPGSTLDKVWPADWPIGLYVDDASKSSALFQHALHMFAPAWVPGETVLILMDFHFWKQKNNPAKQADLRWQSDFILSHPESFEHITGQDMAGTSAEAFRYIAPVDLADVPVGKAGPLRRWRRHQHAKTFSR